MKVCFIGHRKIEVTEKLVNDIRRVLEECIRSNEAVTFLFGSKGEFNELCLQIVRELKQIYPNAKSTYVRGEYPVINEIYYRYLMETYDETYFLGELEKAGKSVYVQRNKKMIDESDTAIFYYDCLVGYNSGTRQAYEYAKRKNKLIYNFYVYSATQLT